MLVKEIKILGDNEIEKEKMYWDKNPIFKNM